MMLTKYPELKETLGVGEKVFVRYLSHLERCIRGQLRIQILSNP